jgi:hypothetical protein
MRQSLTTSAMPTNSMSVLHGNGISDPFTDHTIAIDDHTNFI